jgi:hypothetical protein
MRLFESHIPILQMPKKSRFALGFAVSVVRELQLDGLFPSNLPYSNALKLLQGVSVLK